MRASVCAGQDIRCSERAISLSFKIFAAVTTVGRKAVTRFLPKLPCQYHHNRNSMTPLGTFFYSYRVVLAHVPRCRSHLENTRYLSRKTFWRTRRSIMRYSLRQTKLFSEFIISFLTNCNVCIPYSDVDIIFSYCSVS